MYTGAEEVWRAVPSQPELFASSWGRILRKPHTAHMPNGIGVRTYRSRPTYGVLRRSRKTTSHCHLGYFYRGIGNVRVHRLVCEAFHGPCPTGKDQVMHLDEDGTNNRPDNLRWGDVVENMNMPKLKAYQCSRTGARSARHIGRVRKLQPVAP